VFGIQDVWESAMEKWRIVSSNNYITDWWRQAYLTSENNDAWCKHLRKYKDKMSDLALLHFSIAEIESTEHQEIVMHDINIEDMTKVEPSVLAFSLFSST